MNNDKSSKDNKDDKSYHIESDEESTSSTVKDNVITDKSKVPDDSDSESDTENESETDG